MSRFALSTAFVLTCSPILMSHNIGIGTFDSSEKLEVSGMIYTNEGGIKFPDETVQTTAAAGTCRPAHPAPVHNRRAIQMN